MNPLGISLVLTIALVFAPLAGALSDGEDLPAFKKAVEQVGHADDDYHRSFKRVGNRTLEIEIFLTADGDWQLATQIFRDVGRVGNWALNNINRNPAGGNYRLQILSLLPENSDGSLMRGHFHMRLPLMEAKLERLFRTSFRSSPDVISLRAVAEPDSNSLIDAADVHLRIFHHPSNPARLMVSLLATIKVGSWLVYEALPDKLVQRELGERALIVLDNYLAEENRLRSSQIPTRKKEVREVPPKSRRE